jgi:TRAP-type mannitol/chloroaromatic compound transport system permease small subunit
MAPALPEEAAGEHMQILIGMVRLIDRTNEWIGRAVSWLTLAMVLIACFVVLMRYGFAWGRVWIQETYVWMHGIVFMLGAGYTLLHNGHVRVDIFYRPASARFKAWVDLFGSLLLLAPVVVMVLWFSWPYVIESWSMFEASREAGGLHGLFLLKTVIPGFCILILAQGLSLAAHSILVLAGHPEFAPQADETEKF